MRVGVAISSGAAAEEKISMATRTAICPPEMGRWDGELGLGHDCSEKTYSWDMSHTCASPRMLRVPNQSCPWSPRR